MKIQHYIFIFMVFLGFMACQEKPERVVNFDPHDIQMLKPLAASKTGLSFINEVKETPAVNVFTYDGLLQGSGVGILDIDNDGKMDIYYATCSGQDKLYQNQGNMKFKDVTESAGIAQGKYYSTGVSIVDINQDGYDDIYINRFMYDNEDLRKNQLLINQKDGTFKNEAAAYGLEDTGYSVMTTFFDYDNDNDLDVYVANQPPNSFAIKQKLGNKKYFAFTDNLYRNDGGKFTKVTDESGVKNFSYSLSATAIDYNEDGFTDLFVACDYDEPDILYKNNGNGTFTNVTDDAMKHISNFSMGVDMADFDRDGHMDLFSVDMVAEDNFRLKTNMSGMNPERFWALADAGYHYQYMFNALHRNNGNGTFSEMAQMSGISNTDWSWSPLFIDFDQDGFKDLVVTNGIVKEVRNSDYAIWRKQYIEDQKALAIKNGTGIQIDPMLISDRAPSFKIQNFVYRNNGDMTFEKMNTDWNFTEETWSQGSAYADFDNDGDLDLLINNTNMLPQLYENQANDLALNNFLLVQLDGPSGNPKGFGARIEVATPDAKQVEVINPFRGYMSSSQASGHFGLGENTLAKNITVTWPDGKISQMIDVPANQIISIAYTDAQSKPRESKTRELFSEIQQTSPVAHVENKFDDYKREILLPHKMSTLGPFIGKADVNADGYDDFYIGGSMGLSGQIYMGSELGQFKLNPQSAFDKDREYEDGGSLFFDMDNDGDLDLYVSSGGSESNVGANFYQDRLYQNNNGKFSKTNKLPKITSSTSSVSANDYDGDGDMDLFVAARQVPGRYGHGPISYLLNNQNGKFSIDPSFNGDIGMITDSEFADLNADGNAELLVCGEWIGIKVFEKTGDTWQDISANYGLENSQGWWNSFTINDLDNDGDVDILAGNLGLNIKFKASEEQPFRLFVDDFDENGSNDVYLGYYDKDGKCYPVRGRQCSSQQMPFVKSEFENYSKFAVATIDEVLKDKVKEQSVQAEVKEFRNGVFELDGGEFTFKPFSNLGQTNPIQGFAVLDLNKDGKKDFFAAGNYYNREVETTRSDAGTGVTGIQVDGEGFDMKGVTYSGIYASEDVRAVEVFKAGSRNIIGIFNNNAPAQFFQVN